MATSGTVKTNTTYDSYFWVKWSQKSQSISTNKTTISWSCGVYCGHNFYSNAIKISAITIAGKKVYSGGTFSNYDSGDHTISSGVLTLSHNSDGTRSFTVGSFTGWLYSSYNYSSSGQTYTLTPIPRRASITSAPNFNDNSNPVLRYSNPLGSGVYSLQACIDVPNNGIWEVAYRDISKTNTSYTFNLTDAERTALRKCATGNPPQVNVKFYLKTQITSTDDAVAVSAERTFTVQDTAVMKPSDLITITPVQESSLPQGFADTYIQGRTKVKVEHTAVGKYDASIKAYSATVGGKAYSGKSFITDYINTAGSIAVKGSVTDSRGFKSAETAANSQSITVQPYSQPYVTPVAGKSNIVCARCDENGELSSSGTKLKVMCAVKYSSVSGLNTRTLQLRYKKDTAGAAFSSWITLINKDNTSDIYEGVVPGIELEASSVYKIQIEATDSVIQANEITPIEFSIPTNVVPLHLGKNGAGVGIGRYSAGADRLDVAWDAYLNRSLTVDGAATLKSTLNVTGATTLGGNLTGKYLTGTWLQTTAASDLGSTPGKVAVLDGSGWVYYRTPAELRTDIGLDKLFKVQIVTPSNWSINANSARGDEIKGNINGYNGYTPIVTSCYCTSSYGVVIINAWITGSYSSSGGGYTWHIDARNVLSSNLTVDFSLKVLWIKNDLIG